MGPAYRNFEKHYTAYRYTQWKPWPLPFHDIPGIETVEDHHRRLAAWNGVDPFVDGRGIVRVEPGYDGVETNGVPYWWAAGFQRGDLTVLRFAWGSIEGLGHTLTHELTHGFILP